MDQKKKKNLIIGGAAVLAAVVAALFFALGGGPGASGPEEAFNSLSSAMAGGNKAAVAELVSRQFNDAGLNYGAVVEELGAKHPGYSATIDNVTVNGAKADVSYTRKEIVDKKQATAKVAKESWVKDGDGKWRLAKFSAFDSGRLPGLIKARKENEAKLKTEKDAAEAAKNAIRNAPYSNVGKRDPFLSLIVEGMAEEGVGSEEAMKCDTDRKREFLEGFDLSSFKLSGVVQSEGYYALIEGQNGHGFTVKRGMYIGRRCGKITRITPEKIVIDEKYVTPRGEYEVREVELKLR